MNRSSFAERLLKHFAVSLAALTLLLASRSAAQQAMRIPGTGSKLYMTPRGGETTAPAADADPVTEPGRQTVLYVRGSQIDHGLWKNSAVKVKAGERVSIEAVSTGDLNNPKQQSGQLMFKQKSSLQPLCSISYAGHAGKGQIQSAAFSAVEDGALLYATERTVNMKVTITVRSPPPANR